MAKVVINGIVTDVQSYSATTSQYGKLVAPYKSLIIEETETRKNGAIKTSYFETKFYGQYMKELNIGENVSLIGANVTIIGKLASTTSSQGNIFYQILAESLVVNSFSRLEAKRESETDIPQQVAPAENDYVSEDDLPFKGLL